MTDSFSEQIRSKLEELRQKSGGKIEPEDCDKLLDALKAILREKDRKLVLELGAVAEQIRSLKNEAGNFPSDSVEGAKQELDAIVKSTENATNTILDAAEKIQKLAEGEADATARQQIKAHITEIFTSCNFQDLTGQRITNVLKALDKIESHVGRIMKFMGATPALKSISPAKTAPKTDADLMNGPQLEKDAPSQDDIDKLFDQA